VGYMSEKAVKPFGADTRCSTHRDFSSPEE
jgi:hypothetical protein